MARVLDDEGRSLGLATLEDVIEELVGEIRDAAHLDESDRRHGAAYVVRRGRCAAVTGAPERR